jgi:RNA-directed DNA polymerase
MLVERIAQGLLLPPTYVTSLAAGASHHYKTYTIPKRTSGTRIIHHPSKQLKAVQRWLATNVVSFFPVHATALAYQKGKSIADNARVHAASQFLLRLDLQEFFPSLKATDIRKLVRTSIALVPNTAGWENTDTELFVQLVCKDNRLTIGAPTSPPLSNALCHSMDLQLSALADRLELVYSRYADDLIFSAVLPNHLSGVQAEVSRVLSGLDFPSNLQLNFRKTLHASRKGRRKITGVVITCDGQLSVGRFLKRQLRTQIFRWNQLDPPARKRLAGWLAHVRSLEPDFINSLILKYGAERVVSAMKG